MTTTTRSRPFLREDDRIGVLSPRTPVLVRCGSCASRFGEALGKSPRPCPRCGSRLRVGEWWQAMGSGYAVADDRTPDSDDPAQLSLETNG
jgi:hypothetical protein